MGIESYDLNPSMTVEVICAALESCLCSFLERERNDFAGLNDLPDAPACKFP